MSIVSSEVIADSVQIDGRRAITERHVDHLSVGHLVQYMAEAGDDISARLAPGALQLAIYLSDVEIRQDLAVIALGDYSDVTANHASLADVRAAIRALYQTGRGEIIGRLAGFLLTLTDAQLRTLFAMTQVEVVALRLRLQAKVDALSAVLSAAGE